METLKVWSAHGLTCKLWKERPDAFRGCVFSGDIAVACVETLIRDSLDEGDWLERAVSGVEALASLESRSRGVWDVTNVPFFDLVLHLEPPQHVPESPVLQKPFKLADDIEAIPFDHGRMSLILEACDPPGVNLGDGIDLRAPLYAFVRYDAPRDPMHAWDQDERLQLCIALSRLIRPTSLSFGYSVRLIGSLDSDRYELIPGPVRGFGAQAWTAIPEHDWLSLDDFEQLRELMAVFGENPLTPKSRLSRALWYFEYASRTELIDVRWPLIATAVETVLSTDPSKATRHFTRRISMLAAYLGLPAITQSDASRMWGLRSALVHGAKHGGLGPDDFALYRRMEEVLRATLRRAIEDAAFRAMFDTSASLDAAFPVPSPEAVATTCPKCGNTVQPLK